MFCSEFNMSMLEEEPKPTQSCAESCVSTPLGSKSPVVFQHFDESLIADFNERVIHKNNLNKIIRLCEFLEVSSVKTAAMVLQHCAASDPNEFIIDDDLLEIDDYLILQHNLRNMSSIEQAVSFGLIQWIHRYEAESFSNLINSSETPDTVAAPLPPNPQKRRRKKRHLEQIVHRLMELAAMHGHIHCIHYLKHRTNVNIPDELKHSAIKGGQLLCLQHLCECKSEKSAQTLQTSSLLPAHAMPNPTVESYDLFIACKYGQLECLQYLCRLYSPPSSSDMLWPEQVRLQYRSNFEIVLQENIDEGDQNINTSVNPDIDIAESLLIYGSNSNPSAMAAFTTSILPQQYKCTNALKVVNQIKCFAHLHRKHYLNMYKTVFKV